MQYSFSPISINGLKIPSHCSPKWFGADQQPYLPLQIQCGDFQTVEPITARYKLCRRCGSNSSNSRRHWRRRLFLTRWTNASIVLLLGAWNHLICQGECYIILSKGPHGAVCVFLYVCTHLSTIYFCRLCIFQNVHIWNIVVQKALSVCVVAWGNTGFY